MARAQKAAEKAAVKAAKEAAKADEKARKTAEKEAAKAAKEAEKIAKQAQKAAEKAAKEAAKAAIPKRPRGRPRKNPVTGSVISGSTISREMADTCDDEAGPILLPPPAVTVPANDVTALRARLAALEVANADLLRRLQSIRDIVRV
jgi:hypothetical protein